MLKSYLVIAWRNLLRQKTYSLEYGDQVEMGIIDPTKVVKTALSNAASIAALLLTIDAMVTEEPGEEEANGGGGQGYGHSY